MRRHSQWKWFAFLTCLVLAPGVWFNLAQIQAAAVRVWEWVGVSRAVQKAPIPAPPPDTGGKTPIQHFIFLMQENHSFDNYFGTYPGADGFPPDTAMPIDPDNPAAGVVKPFHIGNMPIQDLSHSASTFAAQWDEGKMDGFVVAINEHNQNGQLAMGFYNQDELPYYYNIAQQYVLFDNFFSSARNGSFSNHMFWVAAVPPIGDYQDSAGVYGNTPTIFDRLEAAGVSWKFYVQNYDPSITYRTPGLGGNRASQVVWVPLLNFDRFLDDPDLNQHIVDLSQYYTDLQNGTLPAVAYIAPSGASEHPPGSLASGQRFVRTLIQELMRSRYWNSSAFMWAYDDWGGWYDHVAPPTVDEYGFGLRVPALLVSAYARKGYVSHTECDFTCAPKFIEYNWGLASMAARDAQANVFLDVFDFQVRRKPAIIPDNSTGAAATRKTPTQFIYLFYAIAFGTAFLVMALAIGRDAYLRARHRQRRAPEHEPVRTAP